MVFCEQRKFFVEILKIFKRICLLVSLFFCNVIGFGIFLVLEGRKEFMGFEVFKDRVWYKLQGSYCFFLRYVFLVVSKEYDWVYYYCFIRDVFINAFEFLLLDSMYFVSL